MCGFSAQNQETDHETAPNKHEKHAIETERRFKGGRGKSKNSGLPPVQLSVVVRWKSQVAENERWSFRKEGVKLRRSTSHYPMDRRRQKRVTGNPCTKEQFQRWYEPRHILFLVLR